MDPHIRCQAVRIPAICSGLTEQGFLIFADDQLMAMVIYHQDSVREDLRGLWYLETGYGPCAEGSGVDRVFQSPDEAQHWVRERVTPRARPSSPRNNRASRSITSITRGNSGAIEVFAKSFAAAKAGQQ